MSNLFYQATCSLASQKKRSLLTGGSIVLAVLISLFLLTVQQLSVDQIDQHIQHMVNQSRLIINPISKHGQQSTLTDHKLSAWLTSFSPKLKYSIETKDYANVKLGLGTKQSFNLIHTDWRHQTTHHLTLMSGRFFSPHDKPGQAYAVVGQNVAKQLVPSTSGAEFLWIKGKYYQVIGTIKDPDASPSLTSSVNETIWLLKTPKHQYQTDVQQITARVDFDAIKQQEHALSTFLKQHMPEYRWEISNTSDGVGDLLSYSLRLKLIFTSIALFCIITAALNLANSQYFSVLERKKEIAIRLAIGARPWQIQQLFLIETFVLVSLSCVIGIALAQFFVWGVSSMTGMSYHWQWWPSFFSSLLCLVVSLITGYFPARATTKILPVHTLRNL